jgi:hypothetical protein
VSLRLRQLFGVVLLVHMETSAVVEARLLTRRPAHVRSSRISLRRRLHVASLITDPGTVEAEWNVSWTESASLTMPTTLKYTPEGPNLLWGRTEYSANFDTFSSALIDGNRVTHSSDHLAVAATTLLADREHWNVAIAPVVTFGFRDQPGFRAGLTAITRYDRGRNSGGATITWTGDTNPTDLNPAGTWDFGSGYGHTFGSRTTVHVDGQFERATGYSGAWSFFEGVEFQFTPAAALEVSGQHLNVTGGVLDHQLVVGVTINFGNPAEKLAQVFRRTK